MTCDRCQKPGAILHGIALFPCEGLDEGVHVADVEVRLCGDCVERCADMLLALREWFGEVVK